MGSDRDTRARFTKVLGRSGDDLSTVTSGRSGLRMAARAQFDIIVADLYLDDISGLDVFAELQRRHVEAAFVLITAFGSVRSAVKAMHLGVCDYVEKPVTDTDIVQIIARVSKRYSLPAGVEPPPATAHVAAHAAARWANVVAPIVTSPRDLRTIDDWSRYVAVSVGTLKSWCRAAQVTPRRSLILARLLRAVLLKQRRGLGLEESLDVVDRRTFAKLLAFCGALFAETGELPADPTTFLVYQTAVVSVDALKELRRALDRHTVL